MLKPKVGLTVTAMPGFNLGEGDCPGYLNELAEALDAVGLEVVAPARPITSVAEAEQAAEELNRRQIDTHVVLIGTFTPDYLVMPLATRVGKPLMIWAHDRNIFNLSLVGAQNVTPALWEAGVAFRFIAGDFDDSRALREAAIFARACAIRKKLQQSKIGYWGGHPSIMSELVIDEVATRTKLGPMLLDFGNEDILINREQIPEEEARKEWERIKASVGTVRSSEADGIINTKTLLYIMEQVKEYKLDAVSINCWPYLKGQVCIPIARLNDYGIPAACEGDLNSAVLMLILTQLSGRTVSFGDMMKVYRDGKENALLFSHCGAGAFTLALAKEEIVIHEDYETGKGLGVYFPETIPGVVTACNLTGLGHSYRMFITKGHVIPTGMVYEGNPMKVQFDGIDLHGMLKDIAHGGFGHHWILAYGDYVQEMHAFCDLVGLRHQVLVEE